MNLKSITNLPQLETVADTDYVIVNSNGRAMQVPASEMGGSKKELVCEFTPCIDENGEIIDINEYQQNVEKDLSWMIGYSPEVSFEIEIIYSIKEDDGTEIGTILYTPYNAYRNNKFVPVDDVPGYKQIEFDDYNNQIGLYIYNVIYDEESDTEIISDTNWTIEMYFDIPITSFKIYKITN